MAATNTAGNAAYIQGLCIDCRTKRHSAGRPRCEDCHATYPHTPTQEAE